MTNILLTFIVVSYLTLSEGTFPGSWSPTPFYGPTAWPSDRGLASPVNVWGQGGAGGVGGPWPSGGPGGQGGPGCILVNGQCVGSVGATTLPAAGNWGPSTPYPTNPWGVIGNTALPSSYLPWGTSSLTSVGAGNVVTLQGSPTGNIMTPSSLWAAPSPPGSGSPIVFAIPAVNLAGAGGTGVDVSPGTHVNGMVFGVGGIGGAGGTGSSGNWAGGRGGTGVILRPGSSVGAAGRVIGLGGRGGPGAYSGAPGQGGAGIAVGSLNGIWGTLQGIGGLKGQDYLTRGYPVATAFPTTNDAWSLWLRASGYLGR